MSKRPPPPGSHGRTAALRAAIGEDYWRAKPSFERASARATRLGVEGFTRADYNAIKAQIRTNAQLMATAQVDTSRLEVERVQFNAWSPGHTQVKTTMRPRAELLEPAEPRPIRFEVERGTDRRLRILFVPDVHVGFRLGDAPGDPLVPIHDPVALETMHQVAEHFRPDILVILGDFQDFAGFSSFDVYPNYRHLIRHSIQAGYEHLARFRESCAAMYYMEGNHEARIHKYLVRGAPEAHGITRAGEDTPVMSIRYLLRLDELGIEYVGPYGKHLWLEGNEAKIRVLHGELLGSAGGQSVAKHLARYNEHTVFGHVHRLECAARTAHNEHGPAEVYSMSCGTLAKLDGTVPGPQYPDWQQGFGAWWAGDQPAWYAIRKGRVAIDGHLFGVTEAA